MKGYFSHNLFKREIRESLFILDRCGLLIILLFLISSCKTSESTIDPVTLIVLAHQYKDQWVLENEPESPLKTSEIKSAEETEDGFHIIFIKETGHDQPEGRHDYYLHIYIDKYGKLLKVVRGPDEISILRD